MMMVLSALRPDASLPEFLASHWFSFRTELGESPTERGLFRGRETADVPARYWMFCVPARSGRRARSGSIAL
jgi:hypothetical protein